MDTRVAGSSARAIESAPLPLAVTVPDSESSPHPMHDRPCGYGVSLLDIAPHHRVLDMYGASQQRMRTLAGALDERGELVANIMGALSLENASLRYRPDNVVMTRLEDERLSRKEMGAFDRVLLDIPALIGRHLSPRQRAERLVSLLLRAIELCREGGRVVYMTHGHPAQNNEMVVDQAINDAHKGVAMGSINFPGAIARSGDTCCNGQQLDPRIARALHVMDHTGGDDRFMAVLECGRS
ncbi:hypothetical protein M1D97_06655 [Kushneria sp. AK178]